MRRVLLAALLAWFFLGYPVLAYWLVVTERTR